MKKKTEPSPRRVRAPSKQSEASAETSPGRRSQASRRSVSSQSQASAGSRSRAISLASTRGAGSPTDSEPPTGSKGSTHSSVQAHLPQLLKTLTFFAGAPTACTVTQIPDIVKEVKRLSCAAAGEGDTADSTSQSSPTTRPLKGKQLPMGKSSPTTPAASKKTASPGAAEAELILSKLEQLQYSIFPLATTSAMADRVTIPNKSGSAAAPPPRLLKKKMWKTLLHKSTNLFPHLMAAVRSDIALSDVRVSAVLLSLVYNLLKSVPDDRHKKAVRLCEKLGLVRACTSMLTRHCGSINDCGDVSFMYSTIRTNEAVSLLLTLMCIHNSKVGVMLRLSRDVRKLLQVMEGVSGLLGTKLSNYRKLSDFDCILPKQTSSADSRDLKKNAQNALKAIEPLVRSTSYISSAFIHTSMALFSCAKSPASAQDLGPRCVSICGHALQTLTALRYRLIIKIVGVFSAAMNAMEDSEEAAQFASSLSWVASWMRQIEVSIFWCTALLQRVCMATKVPMLTSEEAHRSNAYQSLSMIVSSIAEEDGIGEEAKSNSLAHRALLGSQHRSEMVYASLVGMVAIMHGNRVTGLEAMKPLGGIGSVVRHILHMPEPRPEQWQQYYLLLCALYGVSILPSGEESPFTLSLRIPQNMLLPAFSPSPPRSRPLPCESPTEDCPPEPDAHTRPPSRNSSGAMGLLPIDLHPEWFSPELGDGEGNAASMPPEESITYPWPFSDSPIPAAGGPSPPDGFVHRNEADPQPLSAPSPAQQVGTLKHHITRLQLLDERRDDFSEGLDSRHKYSVVYERANSSLQNSLSPTTRIDSQPRNLHFKANFQCGNLQRAIKVSAEEYDLVLSWDTSTNAFTQWFCFSVANYEPGKTYTFNILNMEKKGSSFNDGQRPLLFHVPAAKRATPTAPNAPAQDWQRAGHDIFYFQNPYSRPPRESLRGQRPVQTHHVRSMGQFSPSPPPQNLHPSPPRRARGSPSPPRPTRGAKKTPASAQRANPMSTNKMFTLTFKITMPEEGGVVYIANCFPYTYSELLQHIRKLQSEASASPASSFTVQSLCLTLGGLPVPIITATARQNADGEPFSTEEIRKRPVCVLTARVHPGETNSSLVMHGLLDSLLGKAERVPPQVAQMSRHLLESFVFKIIPMLNPDGVVMGNHRCSMAGVDLNRDYLHPTAELNPTIFSLKQLLCHIMRTEQRTVALFTDFHGHSRANNFLIYGCTQSTVAATFSKKVKKVKSGDDGAESGGNGASIPVVDIIAPEKILPTLLGNVIPSFSIAQSSFAAQKCKRNTGRMVMYSQFGIRMSYTVEGTMVGGRGSDYRCVGDFPSTALSPDRNGPPIQHHYTQDSFMSLGTAFLLALETLGASEESARLSVEQNRADEHQFVPPMQATWQQVSASGLGKSPPSEDIPTEDMPSMSAAGSYVLASRSERRNTETGSPSHSPLVDSQTAFSPVMFTVPNTLTLAQKLEAMQYLLQGSALDMDDYEDDEDADSEDGDSDGDGFSKRLKDDASAYSTEVGSPFEGFDGADADEELSIGDPNDDENDDSNTLGELDEDDGDDVETTEMINTSFFSL